MFSHEPLQMGVPVLLDEQKITYISFVQTLGALREHCQERWMKRRNGEKERERERESACVCVREREREGTPCCQQKLILYIYIYNHPQTDCFVVSQLIRVTRELLQAGIETRLILRQSDILLLRYRQCQRKRKNFYTHVFLFIPANWLNG